MAGLKLQAVTKSWDGKTQVIQPLTLDVADGEFIVMVGPSGCGKSTLLRLFNRLENADSGEIIIHGEHTRHYSRSQLRDLRRRIGDLITPEGIEKGTVLRGTLQAPLVGLPVDGDEALAEVGEGADRCPATAHVGAAAAARGHGA